MIVWVVGATILLLNIDDDSLLAELLIDELIIVGAMLDLALENMDDDALALADRDENDDTLVTPIRAASFFSCCDA